MAQILKKGQKIIIIGGVAGGASCAARLRRLDETAKIILLEKGPHVSFANCGLPYYIGDVIKEEQKLIVQTPKALGSRFNLDLRVLHEVMKIDRKNKQVEIKDLINNKLYFETYDKLVLSPGANPIKPNMPGINSKRVYTLRTVPDTVEIRNYVDKLNPKRALVIGGGFIGLEMVENLHHRGIQVTLLEKADQVMPPFDFDMAQFVHINLAKKNVNLILKEGIAGFEEKENYILAKFESGKTLETDMVILAIGVLADTKLAKECGLQVNRGIVVNDAMLTTDPNIYAIGDAIEVEEFVTHANLVIPLAGPANKQGRIAADQIMGRGDSLYKGTQGTAIVQVFDQVAASTGASEKLLKFKNIPYLVSVIGFNDHATYYPNPQQMMMKLIFNLKGQILGSQIVGGTSGVDKRIDIIATAMRSGLSIFDLQELELAYAPPFSSAKDMTNFAGFVAANILQGDIKVVQWHEISKLVDKKAFILDVRTKQEYDAGHIPSAVNIEVNELRKHLNQIPKDGRQIITICKTGLRAYIAYRVLIQSGFNNVMVLSGGNDMWTAATWKPIRPKL